MRAETTGRIIAIDIKENLPVRRGQIIAKLAPRNRSESLAEAQALLKQRRMEHEAAQRLATRGFQSEISVAETEARMAAAETAAQLDLANTEARAPINGVVSGQMPHPGDYVTPGTALATIVSLDPLLAHAQASEQTAALLHPGTATEVKLPDGVWRQGRLRSVAPVADVATRTFEVVVEIANPDAALRAGVTAILKLPLDDAWKRLATVLSLSVRR